MELSQLRMFKTVAEQGSIVKASQLLHCVPSNITNRIKSLENELGVPLFVRTGRGLIITPSGQLFLSYTTKILATCQEARRALDPSSEPSGILRIGAIESAATGRLPTVLSKYHHHYPAVEMQFSTGTWQQLASDVAEHKLDGAIIATDPKHPDIIRSSIYKEPVILIASPSLGKLSQPGDLEGQRIYMWPQGCPYRNALEQWLNDSNVSASITNIASYGTILGCVSAGSGVSLVPAGIFEQFKQMDVINGYTLEQLKPVQNYLIKNAHSTPHHALRAFSELIDSEFSEE